MRFQTKRRRLEDRVDMLLDIVNGLLAQKEVKLVWVDEYERLQKTASDWTRAHLFNKGQPADENPLPVHPSKVARDLLDGGPIRETGPQVED